MLDDTRENLSAELKTVRETADNELVKTKATLEVQMSKSIKALDGALTHCFTPFDARLCSSSYLSLNVMYSLSNYHSVFKFQ